MKYSTTAVFVLVFGICYALTNISFIQIDGLETLTSAHVTSLGSSTREILISDPLSVTEDITIPSTLDLRFTGSGSVTVGSGFTLTINGGLEAQESRQIFLGSGTVKLGTSTSIVHPEWWGCLGDWNGTSGTDNSAALLRCMNSISSYPTDIAFGSRGYAFGSSVVVPAITAGSVSLKPITLRGVSNKRAHYGTQVSNIDNPLDGATRLLYTGATGTTFLDFGGTDLAGVQVAGVKIQNLNIASVVSSSTTALSFNKFQHSEISNVSIRNFSIGLLITNYAYYSSIENCEFAYCKEYGIYNRFALYNKTAITKCRFTFCGTDGGAFGVYNNQAHGVTFDNCWFDHNGVEAQIRSLDSRDLNVNNCYFEGYSSYHIKWEFATNTWAVANIIGNRFERNTYGFFIWENATSASVLNVIGNEFLWTAEAATGTAVYASYATGTCLTNLIGNTFFASSTSSITRHNIPRNKITEIGSVQVNFNSGEVSTAPVSLPGARIYQPDAAMYFETLTNGIRMMSAGQYAIWNMDATSTVALDEAYFSFGPQTDATILRSRFYDGPSLITSTIDHVLGRWDSLGGVNISTATINAARYATDTGTIRMNSTSKRIQFHNGTEWVELLATTTVPSGY